MHGLPLLTVLLAATVPVGTANALPVPDLPSPDLPRVELPAVELPSAEPPAVEVPSVGAPAPDVAPVELPAGLAPSQAPSLPVQSGISGRGGPGRSTSGSAGESTGSVDLPPAIGGTAPARGSRVGRGAPRRGVFDTRHRTARSLVRALRGCLDEIPERRARLLVLRFGVGGYDAHPAREVARLLKMTHREYARTSRRALRQLVREARHGSCERGADAGAVTRVMLAGWSDGFRTVAAVTDGGRASSGDDANVLGARAESPPAGHPAATGQASVAPEGVVDGAGFPALAAALAALVLGSLAWFLVVGPARAAAARRRAYRSYISGRKH